MVIKETKELMARQVPGPQEAKEEDKEVQDHHPHTIQYQ